MNILSTLVSTYLIGLALSIVHHVLPLAMRVARESGWRAALRTPVRLDYFDIYGVPVCCTGASSEESP